MRMSNSNVVRVSLSLGAGLSSRAAPRIAYDAQASRHSAHRARRADTGLAAIVDEHSPPAADK
jgi:hypothetical protein